MIEQRGDIWAARQPDDWVVVTTNMTLRKDGWLVMGRGIAKEASEKYPTLQKLWGRSVMEMDGRPSIIIQTDMRLISFPVKVAFWKAAEINLILRSLLQLLEVEPILEEGRILMPRPGCGNGHLDWAEVEPMLRHYLTSDRFVVFTK